ncbi:MAG: hypothetical protein LBC27_01790 [Spirochaetaceae bacterium]|jgi:hypothetical protein|nr:hypothetical protein [Spirochaetaceae bacterium]
MSYKTFFWIVLFALQTSISSVFCGPFGLDMGMSLNQIKQKTEKTPELIKDDIYRVDPPNKNNLFASYLVKVDTRHGLYYINAITSDINTTGYGFEVKNTFDSLVASIEKSYGKYKKYDFLQSKSIWNEPNDFMMGLVKNERHLAAFWEQEEGSALPNNISSIAVIAHGLSSSKGYIVLQYSSPNEETINAEKKAKQDSVF